MTALMRSLRAAFVGTAVLWIPSACALPLTPRGSVAPTVPASATAVQPDNGTTQFPELRPEQHATQRPEEVRFRALARERWIASDTTGVVNAALVIEEAQVFLCLPFSSPTFSPCHLQLTPPSLPDVGLVPSVTPVLVRRDR